MNFKPGDLVHLQLSKSEKKQESGLKLEEKPNGRVYIRKVTGLVKRRGLPVEPGDELVSLNGTDVEDMNMAQMKRIVKDELKFSFSIRKYDPDEEDDEEEPEEEQYQEQVRAAPPPKQSSDEIRVGGLYMLQGIKLKEYNGERVRVLQAAQKKGKWEVEVLSCEAVLAVHKEKLVPIPQEEEGEEEEYEQEPEEEEEMEPEPEEEEGEEEHDPELLSCEGYIIEPGDTMKLRGIKKKAKMNGTVVTVLKCNSLRKEWKVELPDGSKMSVAGCNLRHVQ